VSATPSREPIVIDTDVFSAQLVKGSALSERYAPLVAGRKAFVSFQTAAEVRYGALVRDGAADGCGSLMPSSPTSRSSTAGQSWSVCTRNCAPIATPPDMPLHQQAHNADRWIAATAIRLGIPLVSNDRIFKGVPGLKLETLSDD